MATVAAEPTRPGPLATWLSAARPRTLPVALAPVVVGTALAVSDGRAAAGPALAAGLGALLLQIGANFANDVFDFEKGADTAERLGPARATQLGWLTPTAMRRAAFCVFAAALLPGIYLAWLAGWPIVVVGVASIAAGLAYTGGPFPLGYHGLGDLAVFLFFGVVAVCGSYWVQALALPAHVLAASALMGALASVPLAVNNLRDAVSDAKAGKRTLAVRLGTRAVRAEIAALLAAAYGGCALLWWLGLAPAPSLLPLATLPAALGFLRRLRASEGTALNPLLAESARLELVFAVCLAAGWLA